ncbi:MAG: mandelate racemase/muconate lactonizing enzyme family protein [Actinomycetota bacterium]
MKLVSATPFIVATPKPHLGGHKWFFVKLQTDDGLVGWGECAVLWSMMGMEDAYERLVADCFDRYLLDESPLNRAMLTKRMYGGMTGQNAGLFAAGIISAFDVALWDIVGKHYRAPISDLLGGRFRDRIRTYTYLYDPDALEAGSTDDFADRWTGGVDGIGHVARALVERGFTAIKLDPIEFHGTSTLPLTPYEISPAQYDAAERTIAAIREAVGTEADILIGTHGQITPSAARRLAGLLEPYNPLWLEEPCPPENAEEMARIAASTTIPIATGERLAFTHDFLPLFRSGACHIAQPDLGACGGITAAREIASLAEAHYVLLAPHVWGGPIITAAALQLDAAIPNFLIQESIYTSSLFFDELVEEPFVWEDGDLLLPDRPGHGIDLREDRLIEHKARHGLRRRAPR